MCSASLRKMWMLLGLGLLRMLTGKFAVMLFQRRIRPLRISTPRLATSHLASPRHASLRLASPRHASPHHTTRIYSDCKVVSFQIGTTPASDMTASCTCRNFHCSTGNTVASRLTQHCGASCREMRRHTVLSYVAQMTVLTMLSQGFEILATHAF